MLKLGITGVCGKMGKRIFDLATADADVTVTVALEWSECPEVGSELGAVTIKSDLKEESANMDCLIDFTSPEATLKNLEICRENNLPVVIGTTGIDSEGEKKIAEVAASIPIVFSPNMAPGMNLVFKIVKEAARVLGNDFKIKVDETHHVHKKDSPSGTAKMIAKVIKEASGKDVPVEAFREGEVVGNHGIILDGEFENIEIRHDAKSRDVFAAGAIKAAKFLKGKRPGLYSMADVLGIE